MLNITLAHGVIGLIWDRYLWPRTAGGQTGFTISI